MATTFTPEQIAQILEEFFNTVGTRQYIGARYVPIFGRKDEDTIEWDNEGAYEPLTIVLYQGNSYTSRQYVPVGVEITNQAFWALTGNFNAQVEQYRRETAAAAEAAATALEAAEAAQTDIDTLLPKADYSANNTVTDAINAARQEATTNAIQTANAHTDEEVGSLSDIIGSSFSSEDTISDFAKGVIDFKPKTVQAEFIGRYIPDSATPTVQAMCVHDNFGYFAASNSRNTDNATVYKVNMFDGSIVQKSVAALGHANSMTYDETLDKVLVAPTTFYAPSATSQEILVCNADTLAIEERHSFAFNVACVAFDKVTGKRYVGETTNNGYRLYEIDSDYATLSSVEINTNIFYSKPSVSTVYKNDVSVNDGKAYVCMGLENFQSLYMYELGNGAFLNAISIDSEQYIFTNRETQSVDFTSNGDIVGVGEGICRLANGTVGIIFGFNYSGTLGTGAQSRVGRGAGKVNQNTADTNIFLNGDNYPFHDCMEAAQAVMMGYARNIQLLTDAVFSPLDAAGFANTSLQFVLASHTLYVGGAIRGCTLVFENGTVKSLDGATLVVYSGRVYMHNLVISGDGAGTHLPFNLSRCFAIITEGCSVADNPNNKGLPASQSILYTRLDINYGNYYYAKYLDKVN